MTRDEELLHAYAHSCAREGVAPEEYPLQIIKRFPIFGRLLHRILLRWLRRG